MAQDKADLLKKIEYQVLKTITFIPTDVDRVKMAQSLLNAVIDTGDTILDSEMPETLFGTTLDWSVGAVNDLIVGISLGETTIEQDLAGTNIIMSEFEEYEAAMVLAEIINNESVPDSGYTWVDTATALIDALTIAEAIN